MCLEEHKWYSAQPNGVLNIDLFASINKAVSYMNLYFISDTDVIVFDSILGL